MNVVKRLKASPLARFFAPAPPLQAAAKFAALYEHAHRLIFRYIYALQGGPLEEAEDLGVFLFCPLTMFSVSPKITLDVCLIFCRDARC